MQSELPTLEECRVNFPLSRFLLERASDSQGQGRPMADSQTDSEFAEESESEEASDEAPLPWLEGFGKHPGNPRNEVLFGDIWMMIENKMLNLWILDF